MEALWFSNRPKVLFVDLFVAHRELPPHSAGDVVIFVQQTKIPSLPLPDVGSQRNNAVSFARHDTVLRAEVRQYYRNRSSIYTRNRTG